MKKKMKKLGKFCHSLTVAKIAEMIVVKIVVKIVVMIINIDKNCISLRTYVMSSFDIFSNESALR